MTRYIDDADELREAVREEMHMQAHRTAVRGLNSYAEDITLGDTRRAPVDDLDGVRERYEEWVADMRERAQELVDAADEEIEEANHE